MIMTDEEYFDHLRSMFASEGWKLFIQETFDSAQQLDSIENVKSLEGLWYSKGQVAALANILNLEDMMRRAEEELDVQRILQ